MYLMVLFLIGLMASVIGAICGIGGGVIIKPVIDILGLTDVSSASFLSACTVLMMTAYSVLRGLKNKQDSKIDVKNVAPLAIGAAFGGLVGKMVFEGIKTFLPFSDMIGSYQALVLGIVAAGTLLYTKNKKNIKTKRLSSPIISLLFGMALGCMSSFLGIGGGPIDLVVLYYFFSMDTKTAVQNSLFIIFISQLFGIGFTVFTETVPDVSIFEIFVMAAGGIGGGILGRKINAKIDSEVVDKLFMAVLFIIILISVYNFFNYLN